MKELVDKAAVVAEIETLYKEHYQFLPSDIVESVDDFKDELLTVLDRLSTVKDVDLEKEMGKYLDANDIEFSHQIKLLDFATHFFELGFKAKGE